MSSMRAYKTKYTTMGVKIGMPAGIAVVAFLVVLAHINLGLLGTNYSTGARYIPGLGSIHLIRVIVFVTFAGSIAGGFLGGILGALADWLTDKPVADAHRKSSIGQ